MSDAETTVVTVTTPSEEVAETPVTEAVEASSEAVVEAAQATAEAACDIAETEAERDVRIAEIHAETETHNAEVIAEAISDTRDQELAECRTQIATLETRNAELLAEVERLTPLASLESPESLPVADAVVVEPVSDQASEPPLEPVRKAPLHQWI